MKELYFFGGAIIGLLTLTVSLVLWDATPAATNLRWEKTLVAKGLAEYNSTNGNWQWKNLDSNRNK